jgi:hypothetical protein
MGGAYSRHGKDEKGIKIVDHLESQIVYGRIIL